MNASICGVVCCAGPNGEPIACGFPMGHEGIHSWGSLETYRKEQENVDPNLWPDFMAKVRDMRDRAAIGSLAIALYKCQCEFEDDPGACGEHQQELDSAINAYKVARVSIEELRAHLIACGFTDEGLEETHRTMWARFEEIRKQELAGV